jgi:nucleotide-binding universal stress UspA family protein
VPEVEAPLMRDLRAWVGELSGPGETSFRVASGRGLANARLAQLASEADADLLVTGTHRRAGLERLWRGSVSRGLLHSSPCNVACVPRSAGAVEEAGIPTFRSVLIPTDFSMLGNRAIPVGYGLVAPGGVVHLLHVVTRKLGEHAPDPREQLGALPPRGAGARGITTVLEIIEDEDAAQGIRHAAGRLGVDAICMATHGRSGAARIVMGSHTQQVLQRAHQPVFLVPPEPDA